MPLDIKTIRITGVLHNCAMNCALPHILNRISGLAEWECQKELSIKVRNQDPIYLNYLRIKTLFADYYRIKNPEHYTWAQFNTFLQRHSFYANELMLAPILRNFIAEHAPNFGFQKENLSNLKDIQHARRDVEGNPLLGGAYNDLPYYDARDLFYEQFGIETRVFEYNNETKAYDQVQQLPRPLLDNGYVDLYLKDFHYELQPHNELSVANEQYIAELNELPLILNQAHDLFSGGGGFASTNQGLGLLNHYVNTEYRNDLGIAVSDENNEAYIVSIEEYAETGKQFHNQTDSGRKTFAVILLVLLQEQAKIGNSREDDALLEETLKKVSESRDATLARAIIKNKGNLKSDDVQAALRQPAPINPQSELVATTRGSMSNCTLRNRAGSRFHATGRWNVKYPHTSPSLGDTQGLRRARGNNPISEHDLLISPSCHSRAPMRKVSRQNTDDISSDFQLQCVQAFCIAGVILLALAILTCKPIADAISLTDLIGAELMPKLCIAAATLTATSFFAGGGLYVHHCDKQEDSTPKCGAQL